MTAKVPSAGRDLPTCAMIRKPSTTAFWLGRLPHWEVEEGRYFVTLHVAGAIPLQGRSRIHQMSEEFSKAAARLRVGPVRRTGPTDGERTDSWLRLQRKIFKEMEAWLDRSLQNAYLRHHGVANMVLQALEHRQSRGDWRLFEYVIMPNHLHCFLEIRKSNLKNVMEDFKRWTGRLATKILGMGSRFWQREWFDHWSRSDEDDERIMAYIRSNPVKAGLVKDVSEWPYGSWRRCGV